MSEKVITELAMLHNANYARMVADCLEFGTVRLLGVLYKKWWKAWKDPKTGDIVIEYE